ncbi:hypothetical protein [Streptomyces sp. NBC_01589]|uniref:hypothetical protein n=1 Tax=unclassified Streptomyces TaxID=2593676 RepID=UPI00386E4021
MNDLLRTVCPSATAARYARRARGGTGEENDLGENISTRGIDLLGLQAAHYCTSVLSGLTSLAP